MNKKSRMRLLNIMIFFLIVLSISAYAIIIEILHPIEGTTYFTSSVDLNFSINETPNWIGYSLDGQANVSLIDENNTNWCYQESANVSTSCGGFDTGSYSSLGDWNDGNWDTYETLNFIVYFNFTKPHNSFDSSNLEYKIGGLTPTNNNFTLSTEQSCWLQQPLQFRFEGNEPIAAKYTGNLTCWTGSSWSQIYYEGISYGGRFYEEAMWWNISQPTNTTLTSLSGGFHNVTIYANDSDGNMFNSSLVTFYVDLANPYWTNNQTNASAELMKNGDVQVNVTLNDDVGLSWLVIAHNDSTGAFRNISNWSISGNEYIMVYNFTVYKKGNTAWQVTFNDTANQFNQTDLFNIEVYNTNTTITSISAGTDPIQEATTQTITPTGQADTDSDNLYIYCCQNTTNDCTPTTANLCNNNQAWTSPYATMTCTLTSPNVATLTTYYARCRTYDGTGYSSPTVNVSYPVFECDANADCSAGYYCAEANQSCTDQKSHGSTCALSDIYLDSDGLNSICTDGLCNAGYCNNRSVMYQVNISTLHLTNRSNDTLLRYFSYNDSNNDVATENETYWFNNTVLVEQFINHSQINTSFLKKRDNWTVSVRVFDGYNWSDWLNSTNLTILNTPPTKPSLTSPSDLSSVAFNYSILSYNSTDKDNWTDTITFFVYNSSDNTTFSLLFNGTGFGNSTYNWTDLADGDYYWKVKASDGEENSTNSSTYKFTVNTVSPAITLNYPSNNYYFDTRNISYFNFTATDPDGLSYCFLYHNLNGTWYLNQSTNASVSGTMFYFNQTGLITDQASYKWNVWCNDTLGNSGFYGTNFTFHIDSLFPEVNVTSPTNGSTYTSLSINFNHNEYDYSLSECKFDYNVGGIYSSNTTVTCNNNQILTFGVYGIYSFNYYVLDKANNINTTTLSFTITAPSASQPPGGGGSPTVIVTEINLTNICGNGICEELESPFNCPQDCKFWTEEGLSSYICLPFTEGCKWGEAWAINFSIIGLFVGIITLGFIRQKRKKK